MVLAVPGKAFQLPVKACRWLPQLSDRLATLGQCELVSLTSPIRVLLPDSRRNPRNLTAHWPIWAFCAETL